MTKSLAWFLFFALIFLASQLLWAWASEGEPGWMGLPKWLFWIVALQVALVLGLWGFGRFFWKGESRSQQKKRN